MTLASDRTTTFAARAIDLRCAAVVPASVHGGEPQRCQLWSGHGPEHALMYADIDNRHVAVWRNGDDVAVPAPGDWRGLAWMRGFPAPAWFDDVTIAPG